MSSAEWPALASWVEVDTLDIRDGDTDSEVSSEHDEIAVTVPTAQAHTSTSALQFMLFFGYIIST